MPTTVLTTFKLRRDTAANWTSVNPVLAVGEPGLETDTRKVKYGDGATAWTSLAYAAGSGADVAALEALSGTGFAARTGSDTWAQRTITGTTNEITVTNGNGVSGNPTLALASDLAFGSKTITGGLHLVGSTFDRIQFERSGIGSYYLGNLTAGGATNGFALKVNGTTVWETDPTAGFFLPNHGTTASGANAYIDGTTGLVSRSTSSRRYKASIRPLKAKEADAILRVEPVAYRSTAAADDGRRLHWGVVAEQAAEHVPQLVTYDAHGRPDAFQYDRAFVALLDVTRRLDRRVAELEAMRRP